MSASSLSGNKSWSFWIKFKRINIWDVLIANKMRLPIWNKPTITANITTCLLERKEDLAFLICIKMPTKAITIPTSM